MLYNTFRVKGEKIMAKYVYLFQEGNKDMRELLGGKGANLAEMTNLGLPIPSGFTVTTEACQKYYRDHSELSKEMEEEILKNLHILEEKTGKIFGDAQNPLLVSVRSGSRASMPGMMDTVLNLGLNDEVVNKLIKTKEKERFIYDSYRRLIMMYANVVKGYPKEKFERFLDEYKTKTKKATDLDLNAEDWCQITADFKKIYKEITNEEFPMNPTVQLLEAIKAVFRSWNNERAIYYRKMNNIPEDWGTAVNVQEMVYGNLNEQSGTGVAFSRNPSTGENELYGEYLMNAQGEDVVAGVRTPQPISSLEQSMPNIYQEFKKIAKMLEEHYKDMQDMEFTIENGKLYILQTRNGKRTALSAIKIAVDLVKEGLITKEEALLRVEPNQINDLLHPTFKKESIENTPCIANGLAASPGAASGHIYFHAHDLIAASKKGEKAILVRLETSPEDIEGMHYAEGILTIRGGMTSHAAVVARGMGRTCICGCNDLLIDEAKKTLITKDGMILKEGDTISLDGSTGKVYKDILPTEEVNISGDFEMFMKWADEIRNLKIRANAETIQDAKMAMKYGAEGIGLCRTEHMFFAKERILPFRKMILSNTLEERKSSLKEILEFQEKDFEQLFLVTSPNPIVIRYLDPPLHEFLPKTTLEIQELAKEIHVTEEEITKRIADLKEINPMMGHRGCRLAITYPEIAQMQTIAIIKAAAKMIKQNVPLSPEIMIPLVGDEKEFSYVKAIIDTTAKEVMQKENIKIEYKVGTMIEVPRATILADEIAKSAEFFSFGTNDLTQMTYGFSRDDASKFLNSYYDKKIFLQDPFTRIDEKGVGKLMEIAIHQAHKVNKTLELGVCGEQGGEPNSIQFFQKIGIQYVSCSPYRVPIARLAAAQAAICEKKNK